MVGAVHRMGWVCWHRLRGGVQGCGREVSSAAGPGRAAELLSSMGDVPECDKPSTAGCCSAPAAWKNTLSAWRDWDISQPPRGF